VQSQQSARSSDSKISNIDVNNIFSLDFHELSVTLGKMLDRIGRLEEALSQVQSARESDANRLESLIETIDRQQAQIEIEREQLQLNAQEESTQAMRIQQQESETKLHLQALMDPDTLAMLDKIKNSSFLNQILQQELEQQNSNGETNQFGSSNHNHGINGINFNNLNGTKENGSN